jgi:nucleotide-binding universal stress UspA family protein
MAQPDPRPEKRDRAGQRRPQRGQQARVVRDAQEQPARQEPDPPASVEGESAPPAGTSETALTGWQPASQPAAEPGTQAAHPVVVGYDGSETSRNALAYAVGLARRLSRPLLVVYVIPFGVYCEPMTGQVVYPARDRAELEPWLLSELDQVCDWHGLDVSVMTRRGNAARELAAAADAISADALVVGAPGHWLHRVTGSIPAWLARHARCPVIVVP